MLKSNAKSSSVIYAISPWKVQISPRDQVLNYDEISWCLYQIGKHTMLNQIHVGGIYGGPHQVNGTCLN